MARKSARQSARPSARQSESLPGEDLPPQWIARCQDEPVASWQLAMYRNPVSRLATDWRVIAEHPFVFNHELDNGFRVANQRASGRCWLFATMNMLRFAADEAWGKLMDTDSLEFSASYLYFWDKLERYHRYLRYFVDVQAMRSPLQGQYLHQLCKDPLGDGGQWDMAKDLLAKYGVVPKQVYPDSYHATHSAGMNALLTAQLKRDWFKLAAAAPADRAKTMRRMVKRVYRLLVGYLGQPPTTFDFAFTHKGESRVWKDLTPQAFLRKTQFVPEDWVSVVHDPRTAEHPVGAYYQVEYLGNVKSQHVGWLSVPMDRLLDLARQTLDDGDPVWFGCDVNAGPHVDTKSGVYHPHIVRVEDLTSCSLTIPKADRLRLYQSVPCHAMVITGYHQDPPKTKARKGPKATNDDADDDDSDVPVRWKIENSWGEEAGAHGFFLMTTEWFREFVFQIVVHKDLLTASEKAALASTPRLIPPWDALGTLA